MRETEEVFRPEAPPALAVSSQTYDWSLWPGCIMVITSLMFVQISSCVHQRL